MIKKDRVFLVGVCCGEKSRDYFQETIEELKHLAETAGAEVINTYSQNLKSLDSSTYIKKGKISEIKNAAGQFKVETLIFNNDLTPSQSKNISDLTGCNVVDRTEIILAIFALHARTKQAKLQVELAQLEYSYTKLKHMWKHLSRIKGGIGFRGPGEKQLETDRRMIRKKTAVLKKKINAVEKTTVIKRNKRRNFVTIALVGYTNVGKSTIFNKLTREKRYIADQLFATLDSMSRILKLKSGEEAVITDTIGFIRKLPHKLISSFHSTLLEVIEADLLLHVVDISNPYLFDQIDAVDNVLQGLGAADKNVIYVFNKIDKMQSNYYSFLKKKIMRTYIDAVFISAREDLGFERLFDKIEEYFLRRKVDLEVIIPVEMQSLISFMYDKTEILTEKLDRNKENYILKVKTTRQLYSSIQKQIDDYKLKQYINK